MAGRAGTREPNPHFPGDQGSQEGERDLMAGSHDAHCQIRRRLCKLSQESGEPRGESSSHQGGRGLETVSSGLGRTSFPYHEEEQKVVCDKPETVLAGASSPRERAFRGLRRSRWELCGAGLERGEPGGSSQGGAQSNHLSMAYRCQLRESAPF